MNNPYPRLRHSLDGNVAVELRCHNGCCHSIDIHQIVAVHSQMDGRENDAGCWLQYSYGLVPTQHTYDQMMDLLFPTIKDED